MSVHNSQIPEPAQVLGVFSQSSVLLLQSTRLGWISKVTMVIMMIMMVMMMMMVMMRIMMMMINGHLLLQLFPSPLPLFHSFRQKLHQQLACSDEDDISEVTVNVLMVMVMVMVTLVSTCYPPGFRQDLLPIPSWFLPALPASEFHNHDY